MSWIRSGRGLRSKMSSLIAWNKTSKLLWQSFFHGHDKSPGNHRKIVKFRQFKKLEVVNFFLKFLKNFLQTKRGVITVFF
jgi:hypothetical protein